MIELRYYQQEAKEAFYRHLETRTDNPCVVIPTAGGKTPLLASICADAVNLWDGRVLVLAHVKELLEQTADKLNKMCPEVSYGIYSASLKRREHRNPVVIAGIQSVYKRACEMDPFDLVLVDEAHMIPPDGDGMYRQFLQDCKAVNPAVRVGGFTATPYRLKTGSICGKDSILNHVCYEVGVKELIEKGYLSPLRSKAGEAEIDLGDVRVQAGEFHAADLEQAANADGVVNAACEEIVAACRSRRSVLVFTSGIAHGEHVARVLNKLTESQVGFLTGDTPGDVRGRLLWDFKRGAFKYLVNVNVLTTGFDAPNIDCVALLRATLSPGLYYQMVGRGFRLCEGKEDCLVLDFGGNVLRHGPVDCIRPKKLFRTIDSPGEAAVKMCPQCREMVAIAYATCPACEFEFPPREEPKHDETASTAGVLSGQISVEKFPVSEVYYNVHAKRGDPDAPKTMRVDYAIGWQVSKSEWVCFSHEGFARTKAVAWWKKRSRFPVPATTEEAVALARAGALARTLEITVRQVSGEKYATITGHKLGPIPEELSESDADWLGAIADASATDDTDFPFGANEDNPLGSFKEEDIPF